MQHDSHAHTGWLLWRESLMLSLSSDSRKSHYISGEVWKPFCCLSVKYA